MIRNPTSSMPYVSKYCCQEMNKPEEIFCFLFGNFSELLNFKVTQPFLVFGSARTCFYCYNEIVFSICFVKKSLMWEIKNKHCIYCSDILEKLICVFKCMTYSTKMSVPSWLLLHSLWALDFYISIPKCCFLCCIRIFEKSYIFQYFSERKTRSYISYW